MTDEQTTAYLKDIDTRLKAIERYLTTQNIAWNVNVTIPAPTAAQGTMTPAETPKIIGWVTPNTEYGANIRDWPSTQDYSPVLYRLKYGDSMSVTENTDMDAEKKMNPLTGMPYKWYMLEDENFVREDVVTFSAEKPVARPTLIPAMPVTIPAVPVKSTQAKFPTPFQGYIITNRHGVNGHKGIDLATFDNTPAIRSATMNAWVEQTTLCGGCGSTPGKRVKSNNHGYGNFVVVAYPLPDGTWLHCLYAHLSGIHTFPGAVLSDSSVIGNVGSTGDSSGNHLHLQCRLADSQYARWVNIERREVDPTLYFEI